MSTPEDQVTSALSVLQAPAQSPEGKQWGANYLKEHPQGVDTSGEASLLQQYDIDAEDARQALRDAREHLASQRMDPKILAYNFAAAMMAPSKYGVGSQWSDAAKAIGSYDQQAQELEQRKAQEDVPLAEKLSAVNNQSLNARLALQELKERTQGSMLNTALRATAATKGAQSPIGKMVEDKLGVGALQTDEGKKLFDAYVAQQHPDVGEGGMAPQDIDLAGDRYYETGQLPPLGMGKEATALRQQILHSATLRATGKRQPVTDESGQGASSAITGNAASNKAGAATLTDMTKRTAMADSSEQTALTNLGLVRHYLQDADQSGAPIWNTLSNKIRAGVFGDPDVSAYRNAIATARNEYARVISMATGAQGLTDHAMKEGQKLFPDDLAPEQFEKNFQVAQQEMANRTASLHEQVSAAKRGLYNTPKAPGATPTAGATLPPEAARQLKEGFTTTFANGQRWTLRNGQPAQVP